MRILTLDQATRTGWAVAGEDGGILDSGVWELADQGRSGESRGMRYLRLRKHLEEVLKAWPGVGLIVHEQTLMRGGAATEIAAGLKAIILETAAAQGIECTCVHPSELKKFATGNGRASKEAMMDACAGVTGVFPLDDDHADALLMAAWAAKEFGGGNIADPQA